MAGRKSAMVALGALLQIFGFTALPGVLVALFALDSPDDGPPTCDGKVMERGDLCRVTVAGDENDAGYDEMVRRRDNSQRDSLMIGGAFLGGGAALVLVGRWCAGQWLFAGGGTKSEPQGETRSDS
jgi:hypothetical protein